MPLAQARPGGHTKAFVISEGVPENEISGEAHRDVATNRPRFHSPAGCPNRQLLRDPSAFLAFILEGSEPRRGIIKSWLSERLRGTF